MSQSDTPRLQRYTVEALGGYTVQATTTVDGEWVRYKDAHKLERELAEAQRALAAERERVLEALACPRPLIMGEHACKNRNQCWEPCGDLGHHAEYQQRVKRALKATRKEAGIYDPR